MTKLAAGQQFQPLQAKNIHEMPVSVPTPGAPYVHLQFRRFAGCPVCNLHLQSFIQRTDDIEKAGIREVIVFHSTSKDLLPYQGKFPFDVIGDPQKMLYRRYGVQSSLSAILSPGAWPALVKGNLAKDKPAMPMIPGGGPLGLPADFLIREDGKIVSAHYGRHAYDQWSVDELLALVGRKVA